MGGSSTLNYMIYLRGNHEDFNDWEKLGNEGWAYKDVLPYFIKSERNQIPEVIFSILNSIFLKIKLKVQLNNNITIQIVRENPNYHGTQGYQPVGWFPYIDKNTQILIEAFEELGYKKTDANAAEQLGVMRVQSTTTNGTRQSTNGAYIRPIYADRKNLVIKTQAHAYKVIIDPLTKRATGVEYTVSRGKK